MSHMMTELTKVAFLYQELWRLLVPKSFLRKHRFFVVDYKMKVELTHMAQMTGRCLRIQALVGQSQH